MPKLVSHLHLPVQCGSDRILAAMKRGYTVLEYKSLIRKLRAARPDLSLSSDFIVGFPGESEADFEGTMKLIDDVGFDNSFFFIYSTRPGTPAADLKDETPTEVKTQRLLRVQNVIEANAYRISHTMVGSVQRVLVEGRARKNNDELAGRTASSTSRCRKEQVSDRSTTLPMCALPRRCRTACVASWCSRNDYGRQKTSFNRCQSEPAGQHPPAKHVRPTR